MPSFAECLLKTDLLGPGDINVQIGKGYVILDKFAPIVKSDPGSLTAAHLASLRFNITKSEADGAWLTTLKVYQADFELLDEYGQTADNLMNLVIPQYTANCGIRYNDMNSDYAHRINYDSRIVDVLRQNDCFNLFEPEIERHPDIFHPYTQRLNNLNCLSNSY